MTDFKVVGKLVVNSNGQLEVVGKQAKKASKNLDETGKSAATADRRLKGAAQASSNTTKNFSKMAQGISGGLVPAYATLAAQMFALGAVFRALQSAADFRVLNEGMRVFAATSGVMVTSLAKNLQEATGYQIDFRQAAQSSQIMLAAGFGQEQMARLAKAAKGASTALGRDFEDSFNRLVRGVTKAEPELLDELGIILRLEPATKKYALSVNKSVKDLTTFEKSQAVLNEVLTQAEEKYGAVGDAVPVNAFNKLISTFIDLKDKALDFLTPFAEGLAGFFTANINSAVAALAIFVTSITSSVLPAFDQLNAKIENSFIGRMGGGLKESFKGIGTSFQEAKGALGGTGTKQAKKMAGKFSSAAAVKSSGMQALSKGDQLSRQQLSGIKNSLRLAEAEYKKHGKITTGIFAGESIKRVRDFKSAMKQMEIESSKTNITLRTAFKVSFKSLQIGVKLTATTFKLAMKGIALAAKGAAMAVNLAFKAVAIIGWVTLLWDAYKALKSNFDKVAAFFATTLDKIAGLIRKFADFAAKVVGEDSIIVKGINAAADGISSKAEQIRKDMEEGTGWIGEWSKKAETERPGTILAEQFDTLKGKIEDSREAFRDMLKERAKLKTPLTAGQKYEADVATITSAGLGGLIANLKGAQKTDLPKDKLIELENELISLGKEIGQNTSPEIFNLFNNFANGKITLDELASSYKNIEVKAAASNMAFKQINTSLESFQQTMGMGKQNPLDGIVASLKTLNDTIDLTEGKANRETIVKKIYESLFGPTDGKTVEEMATAVSQFQAAYENYLTTLQQNQQTKLNLDLATAKNQYKQGAAAGFENERIQLERLQLAEKTTQEEITRLSLRPIKTAQDERDLDLAKQQLKVNEAQTAAYQHSVSLAGKLQNTFSQGIQKMFEDIATGAASAKDAFKSLAILVLQELAKIAAARMAASVTGFMGFANGGIIPMASGGYMSAGTKRFGTGGIATSPTYMVGEGKYNEAVVPLPDGRRIPVEMMGGGAGQNNVTINVDASGGSSTTMDGERGKALGIAIQAAVMETIQREKRPGGVLSRS